VHPQPEQGTQSDHDQTAGEVASGDRASVFVQAA